MIKIGDVGEIAFSLRASINGFTVLQPYSQHTSYDLAIDNGSNIIRIQVKTTTKKCSRNNNGYRFSCSYGSEEKKKYNKDDVDFIAAYIVPLEIFYIVPIEIINSKNFKVYPDKLCHKYSKYKENWDILK